MDDCCSRKGDTLSMLASRAGQRRVLTIVMAINAAMFVIEFGAGLAASSSALMADSVDMLGDALVYALSLYALSRGARWQAGAALAKGALILAFGIGIVVETGFKLAQGITPSGSLMLGFAGLALVANLSCLALLWQFRHASVNMSSTFECSRNDVASNAGVIAAGALVALTESGWPDLLIGGAIAILFLRSSIRVLRSAWPEWRGHGLARSA